MNKRELIEALADYDDDMIVRISYDYGDHGHHMMAVEIRWVDCLPVKKSDYVRDFVIDENEEGEFIEDEDYAVVLS